MKRPLFAALGFSALGFSLLLAAPASASETDYAAAMTSQLAQSSSPANVKNVLLHQRASYCEQNARNLGLLGDDRAQYVGICVSRNDAAERQASQHGKT